MNFCLDCGSELIGRADKKFCGDHCRAHYNNLLNKGRNAEWKEINSILRKNAIILKNFNSRSIPLVSYKTLAETGFNFHFFTHLLCGTENEVYYCCYNYAYLMAEGQKIVITSTARIKTANAIDGY